jgi:hypothetical protein
MMIKQRELLPSLGLVSLVLSMLLEKLGHGIIPRMPFFEGLFLGLAFAFGAAHIAMTWVHRSYE